MDIEKIKEIKLKDIEFLNDHDFEETTSQLTKLMFDTEQRGTIEYITQFTAIFGLFYCNCTIKHTSLMRCLGTYFYLKKFSEDGRNINPKAREALKIFLKMLKNDIEEKYDKPDLAERQDELDKVQNIGDRFKKF